LQAPSIESIPLYIAARFLKKPFGIMQRGEQAVTMNYMGGMRKTPGAGLLVFFFQQFFKGQRGHARFMVYESEYLRRRHPVPAGVPTDLISTVQLSPIFFHEPKAYEPGGRYRRVVSVTRLAPEKGAEQLIRACAVLKDYGISDWRLQLVGDGPDLAALKNLCAQLQVEQQVEFRGYVPWGPKLVDEILQSDLFVLSSLTEGLPRAVLEAMAAGRPCIATRVGGVPEILADEDIVEPGNVESLGRKLAEVLNNPARLRAMAVRNRAKAEEFLREKLRAKKGRMLAILREATRSHTDG
jgi:glycosyltransferase involved in cell wall biosynthesis